MRIVASSSSTSALSGPTGFPGLLLERRLVSPDDLSAAETHAIREDMELADALVALGLVPEPVAYGVLAAAVGANQADLDTVDSSEFAIRLVPERLARRHSVVPIDVDNRTLTYATCCPLRAEAERDLSFASGRRTTLLVATRTSVMAALDRCYPKLRELDVLAERLRAERPIVEHADSTSADVESTVINFCNHIISRAVDVGASDVHIESGTERTDVRFRVCGVLEPVLTLPPAVSQPIRNRFKIMARADIAIRHRPQDGAFRIKVNGRATDVRLSTLPTIDGEKIVMRVIDGQSPLQSLDALGYDADTLARLRRALARPDGLVLLTGPTGSGKTTALYAALAHLRTGLSNIVSVEDPVERIVPGVSQIPVNAKAGNTFPTVLRSILRQDPNVIMVGEIRDGEVATLIGQAAYTGHLVLSSVHTVDAATAIIRLTNLGLEPYKVAECLSAVLAQRLVRTLCPRCRHVHSGATQQSDVSNNRTVYPASAGPGCAHCKDTGYSGRLPVAELLVPTDDMRAAIVRGATGQDIRAAMRASGAKSMRERALELAVSGVTSIDEVERVLGSDDDASKVHDKPRILVADDEPITRMLVKMVLEKEQFEVLESTNGEQAVEIATREHPDLLVIDLNMPEMDGYEAIARLRRNLSLATLPILVLTAEDGPGIERRVLDLGADDYIVKPFDPAILIARVNAVFRRLKVVAA